MSDLFMDGPVIVEKVEDCGCVLQYYPDGSRTDSGCSFHMPHTSDDDPETVTLTSDNEH